MAYRAELSAEFQRKLQSLDDDARQSVHDAMDRLAATALLVLVFNCIVGVRDVRATNPVVRGDAWLRVIALGPSCLFLCAVCWWLARCYNWRVRKFRTLF